MKHLGDICKISGYTAPIVDCIIGGSPCQDLSVAGKRAGLDGERSGLYMEQIRIVKEMREKDERSGRSGVDIRPRYMVWENVPGAFSSNKGEDFRIVLEELAKVADKDAVIPMPNNEKWTTCGCIVGDGWSIAWRVLDAQFWGVPQRRRRIALVADFGGQSASEILFVSKSLSGHTEPSEPQRKEAPSDASRGFGADDRLGADQYNAVILGDTVSTLEVNCGMSHGRQCVLEPVDNPTAYTLRERAGCAGCAGGGKCALIQIDKSGTLSTSQNQTLFQPVLALDRASFNQGKNAQFDFEVTDKGINSPLVAKGPGAVCYSFDPTASRDAGDYILNGVSNPLINGTCPGYKRAVCYTEGGEKKTRYIVRRLTPLECERLQGYPDGWTDIGEYIDSTGKKRQSSDAARYKALGNSIALPPWKWVLKRICACYERDSTMASLFSGIGGFDLLWTQLNGMGSVLWESEIEGFPSAVCRRHFGDEDTGEKGDFYEAILGRNKTEDV
jgi:DNA (cytosine-5)-methyltransferase 1